MFQAIRSVLWQDVFPQIKLWEFFQVHVASALEEFRTRLQNGAYAAKTTTQGCPMIPPDGTQPYLMPVDWSD